MTTSRRAGMFFVSHACAVAERAAQREAEPDLSHKSLVRPVVSGIQQRLIDLLVQHCPCVYVYLCLDPREEY